MLNERKFKITHQSAQGPIEYEVVITQMPAMKLERWLFRAGKLLLACGAFAEVLDGQDAMVQLGKVLKEDAPSFLSRLGALDDEQAFALIEEMTATAELDINGMRETLTEEVINYRLTLSELLRIQKEAFMVNFGFFFGGAPSSSPESQDSQAKDSRPSKPRISVRS